MYVHALLQMYGQTELSLEEFEQEGYNFEDLEVIASDDNKVEFLNVLSTGQQLIDWLQRETRGLSSLMHTHVLYMLFLQMLVNYIIWLDFQSLKTMLVQWVALLAFTLLAQP